MNLGIYALQRNQIIAIFTWCWLIGTIAVSAYFAFWLYPGIYSARTSAIVDVDFQTENTLGNITYYPNQHAFREKHLVSLSDKNFLYFDACQSVPLTQRPICDSSTNWKKLDPEIVGCNDVKNCTVTKYQLSEEERKRYFADLSAKQGALFSVTDKVPLSITDPIGWGSAARWPLFFMSIFLGLKLGKTVREFVWV